VVESTPLITGAVAAIEAETAIKRRRRILADLNRRSFTATDSLYALRLFIGAPSVALVDQEARSCFISEIKLTSIGRCDTFWNVESLVVFAARQYFWVVSARSRRPVHHWAPQHFVAA